MTLEITALRVALALTRRATCTRHVPSRVDPECFGRAVDRLLECMAALDHALLELDLERGRDDLPF
jgi:hypothetical protein